MKEGTATALTALRSRSVLTPCKKSDWTAAAARSECQERFLKAHAKDGTIARAARAAGITRETVYAWGREDVDGFRQRFEHAKHEFRVNLESIIFNRLEDPKCPPGLIICALKAHWPEKYREIVRTRTRRR